MVGVPMIFRVVGGTPGVPTSYEKDFDAELDAYVTSPNDWEQQVRIREGDKYKPLAERVADSEAEFEGFRAQIEAYRTKIKAETEKDGNAHEEKVKEEGGKTKLCTGDSCAL